MNAIAQSPHVPFACFDSEPMRLFVGKLGVPQKLAMALALVATLASLGMATYAGWQSGGLLTERIIRIALTGVAVLFVHWLPTGWSALRGAARFAAIALWTVATTVVLYGQTSFFMISQQHAGELRAAAVPAPAVSTGTSLPPGRSRTAIAKDTAKVSTDLARAQAARCIDDCPALKVRRARLAAEIMALHTEADEAQRREANEDRRYAQADRADELRSTVRADPVAFPVASWLGTTEHRVELLIGLAYAVVLEGAAVVGWLLVSVAPSRAAVVSDLGPVRSDQGHSRDPAVSDRDAAPPDRDAIVSDRPVAGSKSAGSLVMSDDDLLLKKIHEAVVAGELKPTQQAIRKLLRCGQPKAGSLNRQYLARFGRIRSREGYVRAPGVALSAAADA